MCRLCSKYCKFVQLFVKYSRFSNNIVNVQGREIFIRHGLETWKYVIYWSERREERIQGGHFCDLSCNHNLSVSKVWFRQELKPAISLWKLEQNITKRKNIPKSTKKEHSKIFCTFSSELCSTVWKTPPPLKKKQQQQRKKSKPHKSKSWCLPFCSGFLSF